MSNFHRTSFKSARPGRQRGFSLIEVLVTMLIVALGLLGAAGAQLAATRYQQTASFRNQAYIEAQFIAERMRVNNAAVIAAAPAAPVNAYIAADDYATANVIATNPGCGLFGQGVCTAGTAAQRDMREWRQSLATNLPAGRGSIFTITSGTQTDPAARLVVVMWQEKAQDAKDDTEAVAVTDPTCPAPRVAGVRCLTLVVTP